MKKVFETIVGVLVAGMMAAGCNENVESMAESAVAEGITESGAEESVLAEAETEFGTVRFHELTDVDGSVTVAVSEEIPANYESTPLDAILQGGYTTMEIFKALLPNEEVPDSISAIHAEQATELGRADDALNVPTVDWDAPVEKSIAFCASWVWAPVPNSTCYNYSWVNGRQAHNLSGNHGLHVGQYWAYATTAKVTLGICNDSNVNIRGRIGMDLGGDTSSAYSYWGWATVKPGYAWRWWNFKRTRTDCSSGLCIGEYPTRYRVDGESASGKIYHLKTAELQTTYNYSACPIM